MRNETRKHRERRLALAGFAPARRTEVVPTGVVAALMAGGEDDGLLAEIARERAEEWARSPAGTAYDNSDIRAVAARRKAGV